METPAEREGGSHGASARETNAVEQKAAEILRVTIQKGYAHRRGGVERDDYARPGRTLQTRHIPTYPSFCIPSR